MAKETRKTLFYRPISGGPLLELEIKNEQSLLELALANGIDLFHSCGGMASCTTCRVWIESSSEGLPGRNEEESERAEERAFSERERLACQLSPQPGMIFKKPRPYGST